MRRRKRFAKRTTVGAGVLLAGSIATAHARGVSPYLPLHLEPEIERQIERVLILGDKPVLTRPIAAATVLEALPKACVIDEPLCIQVRRFLGRFMDPSGISRLSVEGGSSSGVDRTVPNQYGLNSGSAWQASAHGYLQVSDYALISVGGVAYEDQAVPIGTLISIGYSAAQLDIGYRGHWLSPMTDSAMLLSTEAPTMPSVTLSNYVPITRLGLHYEIFATQMSNSERILFQDAQDGFTAGHPKIAGMHVSIEPVSGWSLGVNRILQFGGGARGGNSLGDLFEAFFNPAEADNADDPTAPQFGNQVGSITSRFLFPGRTPFAIYFEYAGEDTSRGRNYLLGNAALSAGIHFPRLFRRFDLTYEASEWQNGWYSHFVYQDGLTNDGRVIGHWGADQRLNDVGAQSQMLRLGWTAPSGKELELRLRTLENESYAGFEYERAYDVALRYSQPLGPFTVGAEAFTGRDVFGEDFTSYGAFLRYYTEGGGGSFLEPDSSGLDSDNADVFVEAGVNLNEVRIDIDDSVPRTKTDQQYAQHFALGARRAVSEHNDLGARIEFDDIDGNMLIAVRAIDYRYRFNNPLALSFFLGAARYDVATPAYGIYGGVGAQWRDVLPGWDIGLDVRAAFKVARDKVLPGEQTTGRPDEFYDIRGATFSLTRRF